MDRKKPLLLNLGIVFFLDFNYIQVIFFCEVKAQPKDMLTEKIF